MYTCHSKVWLPRTAAKVKLPFSRWEILVHTNTLRVAQEVLSGEKRICLAITEPDAGSDVAALSTEAVLTPDGKYYKVSGQKKVWLCFFNSLIP